MPNDPTTGDRQLDVVGLFAGVGGLESGLSGPGARHRTRWLCESDPAATAVLKSHFAEGGVQFHGDVRTLGERPWHRRCDLLVAGFPCQDFSPAGTTQGLAGHRSSIVSEVFGLLKKHRVPIVLIENVPFMLKLNRGAAMNYLAERFESLGYDWAYRVVDTRAFGLPQRRRRFFLIAAREEDPRPILFSDDRPAITVEREWSPGIPSGFYWTEGNRGLGWVVDGVPTLKGGSGLGIPSPPAVWTRGDEIRTPTLEDAEALQGLPRGWTSPAGQLKGNRANVRWRLVGNAVTRPVANWVGRRLASPPSSAAWQKRISRPLEGTWPDAAFSQGGERFEIDVSPWPASRRLRSLNEFLSEDAPWLSLRATRGFRGRLERSSLRGFPRPDLLQALREHEKRMEKPRAWAQGLDATRREPND